MGKPWRAILLWLLAGGSVYHRRFATSAAQPRAEKPRARRWAIDKYVASCREYHVQPSADVLAWLRLDLPTLAVRRQWWTRPFGDLDLQPLVELLSDARSRSGCPELRSLDFSKARLGPAGALMAAQLLDYAGGRRIERLDLSAQPVGRGGAATLVGILGRARRLKAVRARGCRLGEKGGLILASFIGTGCGGLALRELDLSRNNIGFEACEVVEAAARLGNIQVLLDGNRVLDESLNAVTHGVGVALAIVGSVFLGLEVRGKSARHIISAVLYSVSLCMLYLASTLFHSFHALGPTVVWVFGIFDHCAIYLLIAGTYCPFLSILFPGDPRATRLLVALWVAALAGMATSAFYYGPGKQVVELTLYLGMGWSCAGRLPAIAKQLGPKGVKLLVLGGIFYTGGVPFFVRDRRTFGVPDHTLWHIFVLAASITHYFCIMWYAMPLDLDGDRKPEKSEASQTGL